MEEKIKAWLKNLRLNEATISAALGAVVVAVVGILVYNYFTGINKVSLEDTQILTDKVELVEEAGQMIPKSLPQTHVVAKDEDLWKISEQYFESGYNWVDIAQENKLANANVIIEGQELTIPRVGVKEATKKTEVKTESKITDSEYTVAKGDTLWKISVKVYADGYSWTKIWEANKDKIANANLIETGQVLVLPR